MSHRSFPDVFCGLVRDDILHPSSDHTKLAVATVSATLVVAKLVLVAAQLTTSRYVCTLPPALEA